MDRCRFCDQAIFESMKIFKALPKAFSNVCNSDECIAKMNASCSKILECGHPCCIYFLAALFYYRWLKNGK